MTPATCSACSIRRGASSTVSPATSRARGHRAGARQRDDPGFGISSQLATDLSDLDADGGRELETVQERRAELAALVRRFGPTLDTAIDYLDTGSGRLLELDNDSDRIEALRGEVENDRAQIVELAAQLSAVRARYAGRLSNARPPS